MWQFISTLRKNENVSNYCHTRTNECLPVIFTSNPCPFWNTELGGQWCEMFVLSNYGTVHDKSIALHTKNLLSGYRGNGLNTDTLVQKRTIFCQERQDENQVYRHVKKGSQNFLTI